MLLLTRSRQATHITHWSHSKSANWPDLLLLLCACWGNSFEPVCSTGHWFVYIASKISMRNCIGCLKRQASLMHKYSLCMPALCCISNKVKLDQHIASQSVRHVQRSLSIWSRLLFICISCLLPHMVEADQTLFATNATGSRRSLPPAASASSQTTAAMSVSCTPLAY